VYVWVIRPEEVHFDPDAEYVGIIQCFAKRTQNEEIGAVYIDLDEIDIVYVAFTQKVRQPERLIAVGERYPSPLIKFCLFIICGIRNFGRLYFYRAINAEPSPRI